MDPHPFGWLSLVPPLAAIILAIATRKTVTSLIVGILVGGIILASGNPITGVWIALSEFIWAKLIEFSKLQVYGFTLLIGAMIGLVSASGGIRGLVNLIVPFAYTRVRGQVTTWMMGMVIFFDDYANSLLLGGTMREVTDRLKVSREKLSYIIDSTAAPVSGLALISTWVATEIGFIQLGVDQISAENKPDAFQLFLESIPYRFYTLWALLLVPMIALLRRDFGPMLSAEVRAIRSHEHHEGIGNSGEHSATGSWIDGKLASLAAKHDLEVDQSLTSNWLNAAIPVGTLLVVVLGLLYYTGYEAASETIENPSLMQIFGKGDSYAALLYGSAVSLVVALIQITPQGLLSGKQVGWSVLMGMKSMLPAILILWFAAALAAETNAPEQLESGAMTLGLDTAGYLEGLLGANLPIAMLPSTIFLLAAAIAFSTGTSWGTMGILGPLSVSLTYSMMTAGGQALDPHDPILLTVVGSVLSGAIFGDHCSPISDTTILSSQSCGCNHVEHVRTQMPYALLGAAASILAGTLPIGFGVPIIVCHVFGVTVLVCTLLLIGRDPEKVAAAEAEAGCEAAA